jgi:hypothetical protein
MPTRIEKVYAIIGPKKWSRPLHYRILILDRQPKAIDLHTADNGNVVCHTEPRSGARTSVFLNILNCITDNTRIKSLATGLIISDSTHQVCKSISVFIVVGYIPDCCIVARCHMFSLLLMF